MKTRNLVEIREEAMTLPPPERATLASELVSSLDGPSDPDAAALWEDEIARRIATIAAGSGDLIDSDAFLADLGRATREG